MDIPSSSDEYAKLHASGNLNGLSTVPETTVHAGIPSQDNTPSHTPTPNNAIGTGGKRRRASGVPGSRGVANLSQEQLQKKRANDREAQRAIRERTRNTIEGLERRIRELESQQPFQELQRVVQERDRALAECEELRRRLGAVAGIVGAQPQAGGNAGSAPVPHPSLNELAAYTAQQSRLPSRMQHHSQSPASPSEHQQHVDPELRSPHPEGPPGSQPPANSQVYHRHTPGPLVLSSESQRASPVQAQHSNGSRLDVDFLIEQPLASTTPSIRSFHSPRPLEPPLYARLTNVGPPSCPLDALLIDFTKQRRAMLRDGAPVAEVLGPEYPDFDAMYDSQTRCHAVSAFFIDILAKFPDICALPEKVAVFYVMFIVLRWQVYPSQACYERLPEWCKPLPEQLEIPHVAYCDYLPWPHMKRQLVLNEKEVEFGNFFVPYCATLSLNWQLPQDRVLVLTPPSQHEGRPHLIMSVEFEAHLRNLDNWSLGNLFRNTFPHLIDTHTMRIKDFPKRTP